MTEDEQEAKSIKYNIAGIVKLSSGRFALFDPWSQSGMPLVHIGSWDEIEALVPNAEEIAEYIAEHTVTRWASKGTAGSDLLASLGLLKPAKPVEPIRRRI